jgi:hypothetical protein
MARNAGSRSPGALLMTCTTSEVAICCSSVSVSLVLASMSAVFFCCTSNCRVFSMA